MKDENDCEVEPDDGDVSKSEGVTREPAELATSDQKKQTVGFQIPAEFSRSLQTSMGNSLSSALVPLQDQIQSTIPDYSAMIYEVLAPINEPFREQIAPIIASIPTFPMPLFDLPALHTPVISPVTQEILKRISEHQTGILEGLRRSLGSLFDSQASHGLNRALLPPNLKEHVGEIHVNQVRELVENEGIPLYLVPRGRTALRLLRAKDSAGRRQVLGECYESIIEDCAVVLEGADHQVVGDELTFALDGLGAMRAGHFRSAQAMFTVTLDTLIYRYYPDREIRSAITNRKRGDDIPGEIDNMRVHEAFVWLPIWNAHEAFWKDKGDKVPHYYSRHASVHAVSPRQFNKRNCIQVLMLITSLIGYIDQVNA